MRRNQQQTQMSRLRKITHDLALSTAGVIPDDWESLDAIAAAEGLQPETARKLLKGAVAAGAVEAKKFRVYTGHQMAMVTYWRFPKEAGKGRRGKD